ncbi:hypothetical protein F4859DRAFT_511837 [Xylaria cf. heliscus]|nr:hypothetical protein F4859DRAFT_511837 [Xylaria cf. heliscus]
MTPELISATLPTKKDSLREQSAAGRARRKQWIDAGVDKLVAEYMEKSGGDLNKAAGFWFDREERKRQQPWPQLEEGEAFIDNMKKDILDPLQLRRQMEEEEYAKKRRPLLNRRLVRARGPRISETARVIPSVDCTVEQAHHMSEAQQPATSTTIGLTTIMTTVVDRKPPSAVSSKQLAPSTTSTSVEMLSTPLTNTSPSLSPLEKQAPPLSSKKRRRGQTEVKNLESDLGGKWKACVTDTGRRPCVKPRKQNGLK